IFMVPVDQVERVCQAVIRTFDTLIRFCYEEEDRERGYITTKSRRGEIENFPLLTVSIAVLLNRNGTFAHIGEMAKMLADLKKATKQKAGSNYMVERRGKY
ncbi:MAG TPA: diguanylate cyclase response regulator, partial [candidate division Zixibacteria bacterium]|nr:diguanylate cyclase response regulator [candidate division Zixibacteria bacterium]